MKRIGILTYTSNFNIGTFFQAYATLLSLRKVFPEYDTEIVNYNSWKKNKKVGYNQLNLKKRHIYFPNLIKHFKRQQGYKRIQEQYLELDLKKCFYSDSYQEVAKFLERKSYDLVITGSDTVLNFYDWNYLPEQHPIYWLPPELKAQKAMLSSSIGTTLKFQKLDSRLQDRLRDSLRGYSAIGVRDEFTRDFLREMDPKMSGKVEMVPDPTFSYDLSVEPADRYLKRKKIRIDFPVVGLDLPGNVPGLEGALRHFKKKGYKVISWRGNSRYSDYDFSDMTPFEWAGMFSKYSITLTNRFHASIFSLKNLTPLIAIDCKKDRLTDSSFSKLSQLLKEFAMDQTNYNTAWSILNDEWLLKKMEEETLKSTNHTIESTLNNLKSRYYRFVYGLKKLPI
jgi:polysaccharide pyruvyl transferase WcaK-like protein